MLTEKSTNHWSVSPDESGEEYFCQFAAKLTDDLPAHHCISIYSTSNQKMITMYGQR